MAYGDGLENRSRLLASEGSNPSPSATLKLNLKKMPPNGCSDFGGIIIFDNRLLT